jgi:hypothetical protein
VYVSVKREVFYSNLTEFAISRKLVRLIKMCLNETCGTVYIGESLSDRFPVHNSLQQGDSLSPLLFSFALGYAIMGA